MVLSLNWACTFLATDNEDTIGIIIFLGIKWLYIFGIITYLVMYFLTTENKDTMMEIISAGLCKIFINKYYPFFIYTIGIINFLHRQLFQPYWMYPSYQLHNWYYRFLRHKSLYIFGIITQQVLYFLTADNKETMMKM